MQGMNGQNGGLTRETSNLTGFFLEELPTNGREFFMRHITGQEASEALPAERKASGRPLEGV